MTSSEKRTKCPFCAEEIQEDAIKCKHCGSMLSKQDSQKVVNAKQHPSYTTFTILGLILPFVGIIVGIVYLTKSDSLDHKVGEHTIAISILGFIIAYLLYSFLNYRII